MESRKLLGFSEKQNDLWLLCNRFFPSKIGGRTAWLGLLLFNLIFSSNF